MSKRRFPKPRKWVPKNPEKYKGDVTNIISRSSWETKFLNWADNNPNVIAYSSEELCIPYYSPIDDKQHRYFPDFLLRMKTKDGEKTFLVEIKPYSQCIKPTTRNKKRYLAEAQTYIVNQQKWEAARNWCKIKGIEFIVLTEKDLF
jgi:hypothetical protein